MQPYFDGRRRQLKQRRNFLRRPFLDVAQQEHRPVVVRQLIDAGADGGAGFLLSNALFVLAPSYATQRLLFAMAPAGAAMLLWLLVKGVDVERWNLSR